MKARLGWVGLCALLGCSSNGTSSPVAAGTTGAVPSQCLTGARCVNDTDCASGSRCNTNIDPPACETLYCGTVGTLCSNAAFCASGLQCGPTVRGSTRLVNGATCAACTMCGSQCAYLAYDAQNCGACGVSCGSTGDVYCGVGVPGASAGRCSLVQHGPYDVTCSAYCAGINARCDPANNYGVYLAPNDTTTHVPFACDALVSPDAGTELIATACSCLPPNT